VLEGMKEVGRVLGLWVLEGDGGGWHDLGCGRVLEESGRVLGAAG